jgi:hypothetical protein
MPVIIHNCSKPAGVGATCGEAVATTLRDKTQDVWVWVPFDPKSEWACVSVVTT